MRWTNTLIPTMKETPADAEAKSHIMMLRAGLIRKVGSGIYSYLPLGWRALRKVVGIVRQEMDRSGAVEVLMPALWPTELFEETGRLEVFADDLMRFTDRRGRPNALAPTHEEVVTAIVRDCLKSYRQLPLNLYQIQTKFRDEPRPRFGVIRTREFIMKDAYSFDLHERGLEQSYELMFDTYCRIFDRCGLDYVAVEAESGAMGGQASHEFMVTCEPGVAKYVRCEGCGYAANVERAEVRPPSETGDPAHAELKEVDTPGMKTIEEVGSFLEVPPSEMIKTLIYLADGEPVMALVRGDHEINEAKLARQLDADILELADESTIEKVTGAPLGFAGPVGLDHLRSVADHAIKTISAGVTGANKADAHMTGVVGGRDFEPRLYADIRMITPDDLCPRCEGELTMRGGIEIGHVFRLGTKYSSALQATYRNSEGAEVPYTMGCYGIGLNRILASIIEDRSDEKGIIWNAETAPYQVEVLPLALNEDEVVETAEKVYRKLQGAGVEVILDDRDEQPGVKFNDADLIGFPVRIVIGNLFLKSGKLEVQTRRDGTSRQVEPQKMLQTVARLLEET